MTGFVVFLILLTLALAIYYSVVIWWDLRKLDQRPKSNKENFDISSMQEEEQPSSIDESGYVVQEPTQEEKPEPKTEEQKNVPEEKKQPSAAEKKIERTEQKLEPVGFNTNVAFDSEQFGKCLVQCAGVKSGKFGVNPNRQSHRQS